MSGFYALMQAQNKIARESAERKRSTLKCSMCSMRFKTASALGSHAKFKHSKSEQKNKLKFLKLEHPVPAPKRKEPEQQPSEEKTGPQSDGPVTKKKKTRVRFRNYKKLELIRKFKTMREVLPSSYRDEWMMVHPNVSLRTLERWMHPAQYPQIELDALHSSPNVRDAFVSSKRLDFLSQGMFPHHEEQLNELSLQRREALKVVPRSWFAAKMKGLLKKNPPPGDDWKKFQASPGWVSGFLSRFDISRRARSNNKPKSVQQRLPAVKKFHRTAKAFTQPPPKRDEKYGRFPAATRYHVDQVPFEPARKIFDHTYEVRGAKRVQIAGPKIDLDKRQCTLQLTFCSGPNQNVKPGICFRATPKTSKKRPDGTFEVDSLRPQDAALQREMSKMPKDVTVYYQKKAWFDTSSCMAYGRVFRKSTGVVEEKLVGLDNLTAHCTPRFKTYMKNQANTLLLFTPDNCTDLCAVTDAGEFPKMN